ncbi:hypothetical protein OSB04_017602 [Centaurea solstitialis]|uniref:Retrovirus-related Pol polyprotein from transposon TNT 1-94 n=1 Tax=Centaurea solstitialis TaxID=347529 RepID=A0AA38TL94_9ASTR|nr:hypothetical protein OSB04_017602 [Centaurea solstitialis]
MVRSMMCRSTLPVSFWGHALETTAHILNKVPTKSVEKTPYAIWTGKKPKLSFLKIWGCENTLGYYFYNPGENKVFVARNGEFLEEKFLNLENTINGVDLQIVEEDTALPITEPVTQQENVETQPKTVEEVQTQDLCRSTRARQELDRYLGFLVSQDSGDLNEPTYYGEVVSGCESEQWQEAMKVEMQSMYDNLVWELTDLPQNCKETTHSGCRAVSSRCKQKEGRPLRTHDGPNPWSPFDYQDDTPELRHQLPRRQVETGHEGSRKWGVRPSKSDLKRIFEQGKEPRRSIHRPNLSGHSYLGTLWQPNQLS